MTPGQGGQEPATKDKHVQVRKLTPPFSQFHETLTAIRENARTSLDF